MNAAVDLSKIVKRKRSLTGTKKATTKRRKVKKTSDDESDEDESLVVKKCQDDGDLKHFEKR